MPWRSTSASLPQANIETLFEPYQARHGAGLEQSMRILPSWSRVMKRRPDPPGIDHLDGQP